jgi:hypothetical protein
VDIEYAGPAFSPREVEAAFIDGHWRYGSLIHLRTAERLVGALASETGETERHVLFSRLFGEFAATLESYAAWSWALQNRDARGSFLDAYLGYSNADVGRFYGVVRDHQGTVSGLLNLPPADEIVALAMDRLHELPEEGYRDALRAQYDRLKEAAGMYFQTDRVIIDAYNKTKHGAPMVRLYDPDNPVKFELILRNPARDEDGVPYRFAAFIVNDETIKTQYNNVDIMTTHIRDMASVTKVLFDAGALYPDEPESDPGEATP